LEAAAKAAARSFYKSVSSGQYPVASIQWSVESEKWEAIEIMAAIAVRHDRQYSSTKNNKKYHPGLASHKGFDFTITYAIGPAILKGLNLTVTSAFPSKPFHKHR
jgi:hypothetical protein